jgi:hypothetical protein
MEEGDWSPTPAEGSGALLLEVGSQVREVGVIGSGAAPDSEQVGVLGVRPARVEGGAEHRDLLLGRERLGRVEERRGAEHSEYVLLLDQVLEPGQPAGRRRLVVGGHQLQLHAGQDVLGVGLVDRGLGSGNGRLPER